MPIYKVEGEKKDGLQKYRVIVSINKDGKYKKIERIVYGMDQAKRVEMELNLQKNTVVNRMTFQQLYDEYILVKQHENKETTLNAIKEKAKNYLLPALGNKYIDKIKPADLTKWKVDIEVYISPKTKQPLGIETKKTIYKVLNGIFNYAVQLDYLTENPLRKIKNFKNANEIPKEMDFYTNDEFVKFIKAAKEKAIQSEKLHNNIQEWNFYVFFCIAYYMGMRKGEINALKWTDIEGNIIHVKRSIAQKLKGGDRETPPKNKSSMRDIAIPLPLQKVMREHKERQRSLDGFSEEWRVCGGAICLRDTSIDKKNREYSEAAGIKRIRIHDYRHSHASYLVSKGINIQEVARRLGHSDVQVTWNTYSHLYPSETEKAVKVLDEITIDETTELVPDKMIIVTRPPIITEQLKFVKEEIERRAKEVYDIECTEEALKDVKALRAEFNKQSEQFEERRKFVKKEVLKPYEDFEAVYKNCVSEVYRKALNSLDKKISDIESKLNQSS